MHNEKIVVRTLAIKRLHTSHTGIYIAELVRKTLAKYEISLDQVVSVTSDNGKNMLKAVKLLQLYQSHLIDEFLAANKEIDLHLDKKAESYINTQLQKLEKQIDENKLLYGVHCAAHTIELAVNDAIEKSPEEKATIAEARELVKRLRTPTILNLIEKKQLRKPIIDCITRWCSTFQMVSHLVIVSF